MSFTLTQTQTHKGTVPKHFFLQWDDNRSGARKRTINNAGFKTSWASSEIVWSTALIHGENSLTDPRGGCRANASVNKNKFSLLSLCCDVSRERCTGSGCYCCCFFVVYPFFHRLHCIVCSNAFTMSVAVSCIAHRRQQRAKRFYLLLAPCRRRRCAGLTYRQVHCEIDADFSKDSRLCAANERWSD